MCSSERVGKTKVGGTLLTEAKYINLSLHFLEQVRVKGKKFTHAHKYMTFLDFLTIIAKCQHSSYCKKCGGSWTNFTKFSCLYAKITAVLLCNAKISVVLNFHGFC